MGLVLFLIQFLPDFGFFEGETLLLEKKTTLQGSSSFVQENIVFWKNIFLYDFGFSRYGSSTPVGTLLRQHAGVSFYVWSISIFLSGVFGFFLGALTAALNSICLEKTLKFIGLVCASLPSFFLVPILVFIFSIKFQLLPSALWDGPTSLILPVLALILRPTFLIAQIFSEKINETRKKAFIMMARAKGLSPYKVFLFHLIPNSIMSPLVIFGHLFGQIISSQILIEFLFALPGLGNLFLKSLGERDYPVFLALVFIFSLLLQAGYRLSDILVLHLSRREDGVEGAY